MNEPDPFALDTDHYLLTCYRYIELNPLRAGMVAHPLDYPWTSHPSNAIGDHDPVLTPHPLYLALGATGAQRQQAYRQCFLADVPNQALADLRLHIQQQRPWGSDRFRRQIEALTRRAVEVRPRGRPASRHVIPTPPIK